MRNSLAALISITASASSQYAHSQSPDLAAMQQAHAALADQQAAGASVQFDSGWWTPYVAQPLNAEQPPMALRLEDALLSTLAHSSQVQVFSDLPLIRETAVIEAQASFDWHQYLDTRWDDISEPIGNALTAGPGVNRFEDHRWTGRGGLRRRTHTGGTLDASQQFGFQDNNSQFFVPSPQGTARLVLGFTQPLMRGRGKVYNDSLICLAKIDHEVASDEFRRQLESHLLEVARSYWALYLERASLYQKTNSYLRGKAIYDRLVARDGLDANQTQLVAAEAAIAERYSDLVRAQAAVANAQSRLRSLVNDPAYGSVELLPTDAPSFVTSTADVDESVAIAFQNRPEVLQAIKQIKAGGIRLNMSKNELMPVLNLVTQTYVAGLAAQGDSLQAFENQFTDGTPSYGIGLQYELPVGNRAAEARVRRRRLEIRQISNQYETTLQTVRYEVSVGVRELQTSLTELSTKQAAMRARAAQLDAMSARWDQLPGDQADKSLALENLLIAQNQLAGAEFEYLTAQLTYNLSLVNLKRVTGVLLQSESIDIAKMCECGVPRNLLLKTPDLSIADASLIESTPVHGKAHVPMQDSIEVPSADSYFDL